MSNNIIHANAENVNIIINSFGVELDETKARSKWKWKKERAQLMAEKMEQIGEKKRAGRMRMCASYIVGKECPECGHMHIVSTKLCRDRMCPLCAWRLSMRRFASMYTIVDGLTTAYPESRWQFVTLTLRNCKGTELTKTIDEMSAAWNKIASNPTFKEFYTGWARSLEITYNPVTNTLHPHYHVLLMQRTIFGGKYVQDSWCRLLRGNTSHMAQCTETVDMTDGEEINVDAILETYKYTFKSDEVQDMPLSIFKQLVQAIKGRRLVAFGGKVKDFAKLCDIKQLDSASEDDEQEAAALISRCVKCGNKEMIEVVGRWCKNGYEWREI